MQNAIFVCILQCDFSMVRLESTLKRGKIMTTRNFAPISIEELKAKIDAVGDRYELQDVLKDDLKVEFGFENFDQKRVPNHCVADTSLMGYHSEANGFTYLGCSAGDDSDYPLFFVVYWDGNKLRAYIPTEGNLWNKKTKKAYGSNDNPGNVNEALLKADILARILAPGMKSLPPVKKPARKPVKPPGKKPTVEQLVLQEINEIKLRLDRLAAFIVNPNK